MKLRSVIGYGLLTLVTILYFVPKTNLYYKLEHTLKPHGIIIHNEHVDDKWLWLEIMNAQLYVQKIKSLSVQKTRIILFGGYNRIDLEGISLVPTLGQFVPVKIDTATLSYTLFDPLNIKGSVFGDFGRAQVKLNFYERVFTADIEASKLMKSKFLQTLDNFILADKGVYHYEYRF